MLSFNVRITNKNTISGFDEYLNFRRSQIKTVNNQKCATELILMGLEAWEVGVNPDEMRSKIHEKSMKAIRSSMSTEDALMSQIEDFVKDDSTWFKKLPAAQQTALINSRLIKPKAESIEVAQEKKQLEELLKDLPDEHTVRKELMIAKAEMHRLRAVNMILEAKNKPFSEQVEKEITSLLEKYKQYTWTLSELERMSQTDIKKVLDKLYKEKS